MSPIHWLLAVVLVGAVAAIAVRLRSSGAPTVAPRGVIRNGVDRFATLTPDRGLDRVHSESQRSLTAFVRRSPLLPGSLLVRLGPELHLAVAPVDNSAVIGAARGAAVSLTPQLPNAMTMPIEVRKDPQLGPGEVVVAVGPMRRSAEVTPAPVGLRPAAAEPVSEPVEVVVMRLQGLMPGLPDFTVEPGRARSIGRQGDLELPEWTGDELFTSRKHATLTALPDDEMIEVRDLESGHGVHINDVKVSSNIVRHGDTLALGKAKWLVTITKEMQ